MKKDHRYLVEYYLEHYPQDAYKVLIKYSAKEIAQMLDHIDEIRIIPVLHIVPVQLLSEVFKLLHPDRSFSFIQRMGAHLVARIFRKWIEEGDENNVDQIKDKLNSDLKTNIDKLMSFSKDSIAAIMNPAPFTLSSHLSIKDALHILSKERTRYHRYLYIVDPQKRIEGVIPFKDIFYQAHKDDLISKHMSTKVYTLSPFIKIESIFESRIWSKWDSLPVVDSSKVLLGVVRYQDVEDFVQGIDKQSHQTEISLASDAIVDILKVGLKSAASLSAEILSTKRPK